MSKGSFAPVDLRKKDKMQIKWERVEKRKGGSEFSPDKRHREEKTQCAADGHQLAADFYGVIS